MSAPDELDQRIEGITQLLRDRLKLGGRDSEAALSKARRRLPRQLRRHADRLAGAVGLLAHPKLRQTLDHAALEQSAGALFDYLSAIDLADRRKGFWLGILGSIAFGVLSVFAMTVVVLVWRGVI